MRFPLWAGQKVVPALTIYFATILYLTTLNISCQLIATEWWGTYQTPFCVGRGDGINRILNSDDLKGAFLSEADRFIKNKPSQYDPGLIFSIKDKAVLKKILDRELRSLSLSS